jgi:pilus assembly protein CpaB
LKRSNRLFLLVGIILAVVAAVGVLLLSGGGGGQTGQASPTPAQIEVVVAAADLPLGDAIEEGDVTTQTVNLAEAPPGALTALSQAEGRTVRQALTQGDILTDATFGAQDSTAENVKTALAQGHRAMAVQVDQVSGVGTLIRPGDSVDVVLSMTDADGKFPVNAEGDPTQSEVDEELLIRNFNLIDPNINNTSIKVLVQNAQVLGTLLPPPPAAEQGQQATPPPDTEPEEVTALTGQSQIAILALTPQEVELVRFAQLDGNLSLVLRSTADSTEEAELTPTTGITLRVLVEDHGVIPSNLVLQLPPPSLLEQP